MVQNKQQFIQSLKKKNLLKTQKHVSILRHSTISSYIPFYSLCFKKNKNKNKNIRITCCRTCAKKRQTGRERTWGFEVHGNRNVKRCNRSHSLSSPTFDGDQKYIFICLFFPFGLKFICSMHNARKNYFFSLWNQKEGNLVLIFIV